MNQVQRSRETPGGEPDKLYEEVLEQQEQKAPVSFLYNDALSV